MERQLDSQQEKLHGLNRRTGLILRIGIVLSIALISAGLIMFAVAGATNLTPLTPLASLPTEVARLNPAALVTAGLGIILLMPVAILLLSLAHFLTIREKLPVITCIVLLILLAASFILILK